MKSSPKMISNRIVVTESAISPAFGHLDGFDWAAITGWAFDPAQPNSPVLLEVWHDDRRICQFAADRFRADLLSVGYGNGQHHFSLTLQKALFSTVRVILRICIAASGTDLPGSPFVLVNDQPSLDGPGLAALGRAMGDMVASSRDPDEIQELGAFLLRQFDRVTQHQAALESSDRARLNRFSDMIGGQDISDVLQMAAQAAVARYDHLHLTEIDAPEVSVVIPVHGKWAYTHRCLVSILGHMPQATFEVIIVDDASTDETIYAGMIVSGGFRVMRNPRNLGFVGSVNAGVTASRGRMIFMLNNDTEMQEGWLDELLATFHHDPAIGIAGSKLLYPDGRLQEVGGIVWRMGDGWNYGRLGDPARPEFCFMRDADYVSGAALMISRELWDSVGGLSREYTPAYYEDTDLCFKVRAAGRRVVVQPHSIITHHEGISAGTDVGGSGMKRFQRVNQRVFFDRWQTTLQHHSLSGSDPRQESERTVGRRALFIDDTVPTLDRDAGSNAALEHMQSLQRIGYKVYFVGADNMAKVSPYTEALERIGIQCYYAPFYWSVEEIFRRETVNFDVVYVHRLVNATKYISMIKQRYPAVLVIYNIADLHYLRAEREAVLADDPTLLAKVAIIKQAELSAISDADRVIVHSSHERDIIAEAVPGAKVSVISWVVRSTRPALEFEERHGVAFIGGFNHTPNVDAASWLVREIMPLVWIEDPTIHCSLIGSDMPASLRNMSDRRVHAIGHVPALMPVLNKLRLTVAPLRYGAGLKGKVLTSLAAGLPCVGTSCAFEGMELPKQIAGMAASDPATIAAAILLIHRANVKRQPVKARNNVHRRILLTFKARCIDGQNAR